MEQRGSDTGGRKYRAIVVIAVESTGSLSNGFKIKRAHKVSSSCVSKTEMKTLSPSGYVPFL